MKNIPFLFLALLSAHFVSARSWVDAKRFEIGASVGASYNNAIHNASEYGHVELNRANTVRPVVNISVARTHKHWQYGLTTGYNSVVNKIERKFVGHYLLAFFDEPVVAITRPATISYTYIPAQLFANLSFQLGAIQLYGGIAAGVAIPVATQRFDDITSGAHNFSSHTNVTAGIHSGITVPLNHVLSFNTEGAANFVNMDSGYYVFTYPVTVGVKCKL